MKQLISLALLLFFFSCGKDRPLTVTEDAYVVDEGSVIVDGCGWHIVTLSGTDYIPDHLDTSFETDSLPVTVTYTSVDSAGCGLTANIKTHKLMVVKKMKKR